MEYEFLGKSDLRVTKIGLGTWQFGSEFWGWGKDFGEQDAVEAIKSSLEKGINWIDTAEVYGDGFSEELIGKILGEKRKDVIIATKVSGSRAKYQDVIVACEGSLKRLRTNYIDLYQFHWPNFYIPVEETMRAMEELVNRGKVRYIGVSNFPVPLIGEAQKALKKSFIVSNQVRYNLISREIDEEILPYCVSSNISIIAYSPIAQGLLTGKYTHNKKPDDSLRKDAPFFREPNYSQIIKFVELLTDFAEKIGKNPAQVALRWLIEKKGIVAIPGAKNKKQAEENVGAMGWKLDEEILKKLDEESKKIKITHITE
ncbi:MAG: aldo/keto reductase [candidate division WOR-3 bacterium]|nr:aldo/keto reductase [candidate division WOR-3 bacterium]